MKPFNFKSNDLLQNNVLIIPFHINHIFTILTRTKTENSTIACNSTADV